MEAGDPPSRPSEGSEPRKRADLGGFRPATALLTLGLSAAAAVAVGGALGYLLDRWVGTLPVFTVIGLALGVLTAVMMTITQVRRYL